MEKQPIEQEVMTIERLKELRSEMIKDLDPDREIYNHALEKWDSLKARSEKKFLIKLNLYFDQILTDKNGETVRIGDVLILRKYKYQVVDRSLQIVFGEILNNPRVTVMKFKGDEIIPNSRRIDLCVWELLDFEIVKELK